MNRHTALILILAIFLTSCTMTGRVIQDASSSCVKGDINLDGSVDENDIIVLDAYLSNDISLNYENTACGDMDNNNILDVKDRETIKNMLK